MKALSWINFALGVWLLVAAFIFASGTDRVMTAESVTGTLIAVLAYASAVARPAPGVSWAVAAAGLWGLLLNYAVHTPPRTHALVVSFVVLVLGTMNARLRHEAAPPQVHG